MKLGVGAIAGERHGHWRIAPDRNRNRVGRPGDGRADRAGDPAERPPLRRPRAADARRRHAAAERRPERAASRAGLVLVLLRGQPRDVGQLHDQRHQPERPVEQPGHVPAVDQHRVGVQGRQLDVQRRVRPQLRRDRERRDALGRQPRCTAKRSTSTATTSSTRGTTSTPSRTRSRRSTASSSASISAGRSRRTRRSTSSATKGCATRRAST